MSRCRPSPLGRRIGEDARDEPGSTRTPGLGLPIMSVMQRVLVTGRVRQVGYRDYTVRMAKSLGVTGWVRNRIDGAVEILASGEEEAVAALVEACRGGPPLARVDHVEAYMIDEPPVKGFTKRFTA